MKKYSLLIFALLISSLTFVGCGDDDEKAEALPLGEPIDPPNCSVAVNPTIMPKDGLVIMYNLYNTEGKRTNEFKYGENIIFAVEFCNLTDKYIYIAHVRKTNPRLFPSPWYDGPDMTTGIFNVHSKDGKFIGYPYVRTINLDYDETMEGSPSTCIPMKNYEPYGDADCGYLRFCAAWLKVGSKYKYDIFDIGQNLWFSEITSKNPLPVGEYYSEFDVNIGKGATYPIRVEFRVIK